MNQPDLVAAPARRRRRRRALVGGIVVILLIAGGAVAMGRTSWWACHTGTRAGDEALDYSVEQDAVPGDLAALVEQIQSVPGVGSLAGSATLEDDVRLVPNANGDLLVSDEPYFAQRNQFHDTSLDPLSGETSWSRGQAGQAAAPAVTGVAVLNFAAVEGGT